MIFPKLNPAFPTKEELSDIENDLSSYLIDQGLRVDMFKNSELFVSWERDNNVPIEFVKVSEVREHPVSTESKKNVKINSPGAHPLIKSMIPVFRSSLYDDGVLLGALAEKVYAIHVIPYGVGEGLFLTKNKILLQRDNATKVVALGRLQAGGIAGFDNDDIIP